MGFVKLEKQGHVGIVTIDRQEALNALNSQVLSDLDAVIDQVAADDEARHRRHRRLCAGRRL